MGQVGTEHMHPKGGGADITYLYADDSMVVWYDTVREQFFSNRFDWDRPLTCRLTHREQLLFDALPPNRPIDLAKLLRLEDKSIVETGEIGLEPSTLKTYLGNVRRALKDIVPGYENVVYERGNWEEGFLGKTRKDNCILRTLEGTRAETADALRRSIEEKQREKLIARAAQGTLSKQNTLRPDIPSRGQTRITSRSLIREVDDYEECSLTWQELADIAHEVADCAPHAPEKVRHLLKDSGLVDPNGTLNLISKSFCLLNGQRGAVRIVGIAHDKTADGSIAGLTFGFITPICYAVMNSQRSNAGGWKDSDLRTMLERQIVRSLLPDEITIHMKYVLKATNNVGLTTSYTSVSSTEDRLWLFSRRELAGDWYAREKWPESPESPLYDMIADSEGEQYQLFNQLGVDDPYGVKDCTFSHQRPIVILNESEEPIKYWLRSPDPDNDRCFGIVEPNGGIANGVSSNGRYALVPGFCF